MFRSNWESTKGKTAVTIEELTEAEAEAARLITAVGIRDAAPPAAAESALLRQRAYTLFLKNYDDVRRVVIFLRWHEGDADEIAPSLYAGRSGGRRKQDDEQAPAAPQSTTAAPTLPKAPEAPVSTASTVAVGMPNSSPFA